MQKLMDLKEEGEAAVAASDAVPLLTTEVGVVRKSAVALLFLSNEDCATVFVAMFVTGRITVVEHKPRVGQRVPD